MIEVIPTIIAKSYEELEHMVRKLEPHVDRVHLDIMDGIFVGNETITGYEELQKLQTNLKFDVHLMIREPAQVIDQWLATSADRFCLHRESNGDLQTLFQQIAEAGKKSMLVLNPETPVEKSIEFLDMIEYIQFMTVHPGSYGGQFLPEVIEKISQFHAQYPTPISVDGGVTPETVPGLITAGASVFCCGSYIMQSSDIATAIASLKNLSS